ncbi:MAG: hypothetical protein JWM12_1287 [Ilumatobacteraceae bacterium]|nr:hypothetical protein [Ilumatobacteraceae bacterium]
MDGFVSVTAGTMSPDEFFDPAPTPMPAPAPALGLGQVGEVSIVMRAAVGAGRARSARTGADRAWTHGMVQAATMPIVPAGSSVELPVAARLPSLPMRNPLITCSPSVRL